MLALMYAKRPLGRGGVCHVVSGTYVFCTGGNETKRGDCVKQGYAHRSMYLGGTR